MRTSDEVIKTVLQVGQDMDEVKTIVQTDLVPIRKYLYSYNFYFIVDCIDVFEGNDIFETCFGKRILLYRSDKNYPELFPNTKAHLMVFEDGITIVINAIDRESFMEKYRNSNSCESMWIGDTYKKLLDKEGILPDIERLEEKKLLMREIPTKKDFDGICSEFYWVLKTYAEYTLRKELPSAMFYLNISIRELLNRMLHWYICMQSDEPVEIGILDSNLEGLLEEELFQLYKKTYPSADYEKLWEAYEAVTLLWNTVGHRIAGHYQFTYPDRTEKEMKEFITNLRKDSFV